MSKSALLLAACVVGLAAWLGAGRMRELAAPADSPVAGREAFARNVEDYLREAGVPGPFSYDAATFSLVVGGGDGGGQATYHLASTYDEY